MAYELRDNSGSLFRNEDQSKSEYSGTVMIAGVEYWINAWVKEGKKGKFFSLSFRPKQERVEPGSSHGTKSSMTKSHSEGIASEEEVHEAMEFIRQATEPKGIRGTMAAARKNAHMVKVAKALAMKHSGAKTVGEQEREAYASPEYEQAVDDDAAAAGLWEELQAKLKAAYLTCEMWRTQRADNRNLPKF